MIELKGAVDQTALLENRRSKTTPTKGTEGIPWSDFMRRIAAPPQ
jgi:hypothetical protein